MKWIKRWGLPLLTGVLVLVAILLPRQISFLRDRQTLGSIHVEFLTKEESEAWESTLPERLELLGRAIRYPNLEVYSTVQALDEQGDDEIARGEEKFFQGIEYLMQWEILPESFDKDILAFQGGSRAVYVQANGLLSASMLYLQGNTENRDNFWLVIDEESGFPIWIDCTLRSVAEDVSPAEELGQRFCEGLGLKIDRRGPAVWEVEDAGGLVYSALAESDIGRISIEPLGFVWDIFSKEDGVSG